MPWSAITPQLTGKTATIISRARPRWTCALAAVASSTESQIPRGLKSKVRGNPQIRKGDIHFQPSGEENAFAPLSASLGEALGETTFGPCGSLELLASSWLGPLTSCLVMSELGDLNQVKLLSLALTPLSSDKFDLTDPEGPLESRFCDPRWSRSSLSSESLAKAPSSLPREGFGLDLATEQTMTFGSAWQGHPLSPSALMVSQRPAGGPDPGPPSLQ